VRPIVVVFACLLALVTTGCAAGERADDVAAVTARFHAALEAGDGPAACAELSAETVSKLERDEEKPCEEAILGLDLPKGGTIAVRRVEMRSAYTRLAEGGADFLNEGPDGWKISAAGCEPTVSGRPYECELEG
jgi:hypothetical protein